MPNVAWSYEASVETRWLRTLFMIVWAGMCLAMVGILGFGLATTPSRIDELVLLWLVLVVAAFFAVNYLSWQLRGKEVITISAGSLELHNTGTLFRRRLKLALDDIEDITSDEDTSTPYWIKHWGIGGGKVVIHYLGRNRRYGQDMGVQEAKRIAAEIRAAIGR